MIEYRIAYGTPELLDMTDTFGVVGAVRYQYVSYRGFTVNRSVPVDTMEQARVELDKLVSLQSAINVRFVPNPNKVRTQNAEPSEPVTP